LAAAGDAEVEAAPETSGEMPKRRRRESLLQDALVWVDCEMTGLGADGGPGNDRLLEVACIVTDADLNVVAEGPDLVIHWPDDVLEGMNDWCKDQFGWKGDGSVTPGLLAEAVQKSEVSVQDADRLLVDFVQKHVAKKKGVLAGNTVHMDKRFLDKFCPGFTDYLHYRLVDVSTVKELCRRWHPDEFRGAPVKKGAHRALDDIRESLEELRYYRGSVFKKVG